MYPLDYSVSSIQLYNELNGESDAAFLNKLDAAFHRDETNLCAGFMLVQVQIQKGNIQAAVITLEKLLHALKGENDVKYVPGLVCLAVSLFRRVGKEERATALLIEAKAYWSGKENLVIPNVTNSTDTRMPIYQPW